MKQRFLSREEYEFILKQLLCAILGTLFSWLVGDLYSPTTAITANLFLWTDRGYRGSVRYALRRVVTQIIQGAFVVGIILPCRYYQLPVPDLVLIVVSCCAAMCVGFPINYKKQFSPFTCTLANASLIIACATVQDLSVLPMRVLQCVVGGLIGYFVHYIVFPRRDRAAAIRRSIRESVAALVREGSFGPCRKNALALDKDFVFLAEDNETARGRFRVSPEEIALLQTHRELLAGLKNYMEFYQAHESQLSGELKAALQPVFAQASALHLRLVEQPETLREGADPVAQPPLPARAPLEICAAGRLLEYTQTLNSFIQPA